jgi:hypothetical protein
MPERAPIWLATCGGRLEREKVMGERDSDQNYGKNRGGYHLRLRRGFTKIRGVLMMAIGARSQGIGCGVCACSRDEWKGEERGSTMSFIGEWGHRMDGG